MQKFDKHLKVATGSLACLGLFLSAGSLCAQTNASRPKFPSNRFLFVIDTSKGMDHRAQGSLKALEELLLSEVSGQMRPGDSMAIWTFNDDLHAGKFPLQLWTTQTRRSVLLGATTFLKDQKYEKQGSLEKVIPQMEYVIKNSEFITVILITDGSEKMAGTPFDERINEYYGVWQKEQQAAHMPFLTLIRAKKGRITDYSVSAYPWPLDIPALPQELLVAKAKPAEPKPLPPPIGQPLIVVGKKPQTPPAGEPQISQPVPEAFRTNVSVATETPAATPPAKGPEPASLVEAKPEGASSQPGANAAQAAAGNEPSHTTTLAQANPQPSASAPAPSSTTPVVAEPTPGPGDKSPGQSMTTEMRQPASPGTTPPAGAEGQVALPSNALLSQRNVLLAGAAILLLIAAALTARFLRRPRPAASSASLITRSLERETAPEDSEHVEGSGR
jgi:hypothetical protein